MTPQSAKLEAIGLRKMFAGRRGREIVAIEDISLAVADREFVCIVGASGCGKSTLLRLVAGLEEPTAGSLLLDGQEIAGAGRDRGMVFQQYTLFPWLTVRRNVEFGLRDLGRRERLGVARHFLDLVGLRRFEDSYPGELSGGMQQRTAIARALAYKPEILLMDEPFGALDAQTRGLMQDLLLRIWAEEGLTVLFVTHDVDEAVYLSDRIYVLSSHPGRIKEEITVPLVRPRRYEQQLTSEFLELKSHVRNLIHHEAAVATEFEGVLD
ncbi:MAG: ABC transporter ATP-binding protein [Actinomycetota bacterium]|nr:ABC transporter ATP-binding protein [Actinomycetota bacterium]